MSHLPPAIFLMGPTASGKTGLAIALRQRFPVELISVDSALVYRGMDIGTAKPSDKELAQAPHRLISFLDPSESYSAADFRRDALREMASITDQGRVPLLVGGTSLYFRALEQGLAVLPPASAVIRRELEREAAKSGWGALHERLASIDPPSAEKIHPNDPQRIQRALEVYLLTGKALSTHHREAASDGLPYRLLKLALIPADREWLRERAALRFDQMLEQGFLDEVASLHARGDLHTDLPAVRAVGYRQVWDYLEGRLSKEAMRERAIIATRQLAKRQMTWLRSEKNVIRIPAEQVSVDPVCRQIESFLEVVD